MTSTADTDSSQKTVRVAVAVPLDRTFDYNYEGPVVDGPVADGPGPLPRGTIVSVPLARVN